MADKNTNMAASAVEEKQQQQTESPRVESPTNATVSSSDVGDAIAAIVERPDQTVREEPGKRNPASLDAEIPPEIVGPSSSAPVSGGATAVTPGPEVEGGSTSSEAPPVGVQLALEGGLPDETDNSGGQQSVKKGREETSGSGSGILPKRARGELDAPRSEPACAICGKQFATWKGVFGHLRAHPDRQWRGAFPPPMGKWSLEEFIPINPDTTKGDPECPSELERQLAPTLLSIAKQSLVMMREDAGDPAAVASSSAAGPSRLHHNIDLNVVPEASSSGSSPSAPVIKEEKGFDLNLPPPENEDGSE